MVMRELSMKNDDLIKRYVDAASFVLYNTDNEKYPIRVGRIAHMFTKEYFKEFIDDLNSLKDLGYSYSMIGGLFENPTIISRMSHHILKGAKQAGFSLDEQKKLVLELISIISHMKQLNYFNEDGKNILLKDKEINELLDRIKLIKATNESSKIIHKLCGMMWAYSETPYFVAHDIAIEEHGIYNLSIGRMIIRDLINLRPTELWSECEDFPYESMRIVCVYDDKYNAWFDFYGNLYSKDNPVSSLISYYIEGDCKEIDIEKVDKILDISSKIISSIISKVELMSDKEIAKKYADIFWYRKRPLCDEIGRTWRPRKKIYKLIDKGEIKPEIIKNVSQKEIKEKIGLT